MAQTKKPDIQERILREARKEFLKVGFQKANLRRIAVATKISLANLYSYYQSKDAVFCAVVEGVRTELEGLENFFRTYQPEHASLDPLKVEIERAKLAARHIHKHRIDLHLLFNKAQGTSLEGFSERLVDGYVINCRNFLSFLTKNGFSIPIVPTDFFFASVGRMFVEATREVVRSKSSLKAIEKQAEEIARYNHFGFRGVSAVKT